MYNYPLADVNGNTIGVISLERDDLPNMIMKDEYVEFRLMGSWRDNGGEKKFMSFTIIPKVASLFRMPHPSTQPALPKEPDATPTG